MSEADLNRLIRDARILGFKIYDGNEETHRMFAQNGVSCDHIKPYTFFSWITFTICPILLTIPNFILTILNPCLNYTSSLYILVITLFSCSSLFSYIHLCLYTQNVWYCNFNILKIHNLQVVIYYSLLGATLGFLNLYAYDTSFWYFIAACITFFMVLVLYFIVLFQRKHFYYCPDDGCKEIPDGPYISNFTLDDIFSAFATLFILTWVSLLIVSIALSDELYINQSSRSLSCPVLV